MHSPWHGTALALKFLCSEDHLLGHGGLLEPEPKGLGLRAVGAEGGVRLFTVPYTKTRRADGTRALAPTRI